jgi:hypothetical protein
VSADQQSAVHGCVSLLINERFRDHLTRPLQGREMSSPRSTFMGMKDDVGPD